MKLLRPLIGLFVIASLTVCASAQTAGKVDLEALKTLRHDLNEVFAAMRPTLPIYEGHKAECLKSVNEVRKVVHEAIVAAEPPVPAKPVVPATPPATPPANPKEKTEKKITAPRTSSASITLGAKKEEKILPTVAESQAAMRKGLEVIQKALNDLKAAAASLPADQVTSLTEKLKAAEAEANKSIELHSKEG